MINVHILQMKKLRGRDEVTDIKSSNEGMVQLGHEPTSTSYPG